MSRFFEALRQANSSPLNSVGTPVGDRADDIVDKIVDTLEFSGDPTHLATPPIHGVPKRVAAEPTVDPWEITREPEIQRRRDRSHIAAFTALTRAAVDQNVRIIPNSVDRALVEHYRRLRTKLMQQHAIKPYRSLVVTSASPQEGKSVTVLNVGLSFAMLPAFRVLVVDGDMRRNTVGKWLGAAERPGLSNLLEGTASMNDVVFTCEDSPIHFIAGGTSKKSAAELLHSSTLSAHFRCMTEQFDLVLIDSPPVNLIADAQLLAAHADAVLLVARAFKTTRKSLEKAVQDLTPFRVVGTVLNASARGRLHGTGYGEYY